MGLHDDTVPESADHIRVEFFSGHVPAGDTQQRNNLVGRSAGLGIRSMPDDRIRSRERFETSEVVWPDCDYELAWRESSFEPQPGIPLRLQLGFCREILLLQCFSIS